MGFLGNLFRKKTSNEESKTGGIEDFMTLIRVYYQAVMASNLQAHLKSRYAEQQIGNCREVTLQKNAYADLQHQ